MSTKAIQEALDYLENNPTADDAQDARRRARREVEAIGKAARAVVERHPSPPPNTFVGEETRHRDHKAWVSP